MWRVLYFLLCLCFHTYIYQRKYIHAYNMRQTGMWSNNIERIDYLARKSKKCTRKMKSFKQKDFNDGVHGWQFRQLKNWHTSNASDAKSTSNSYSLFLFPNLRNGTGAIGMKNTEVEGHLPMQSTIQHITDYSNAKHSYHTFMITKKAFFFFRQNT